MDTEGNLWIAIWGAGEVRCYTSAGKRLATVDVPAPHTSSVAFVGPARDTLLITTARASCHMRSSRRFRSPAIRSSPTSAQAACRQRPGHLVSGLR